MGFFAPESTNMLIYDFNQIMYSTVMVQLHGRYAKDMTLDEGLLRHMTLNMIRSLKKKFSQYPNIIIATDSHSWRKDTFSFYKAKRKIEREKDLHNWEIIFESFKKIREELRDNFPYRVINVYGAEADDIIATLVYASTPADQIMILSGDKDLRQLQSYPNVKQYDPVQKKIINESDPEAYLIEHIIRGDSGDGIPNILSDDDSLVNPEKRQLPLTKKKYNEIFKEVDKLPNWERNKILIDLRNTPLLIKTKIVQQYKEQTGKNASKLFNYFVKNKLNNLMQDIGDFR